MNVTLTRELETLIRQKVDSGKYESPSEVVREALRLLAERDEARRAQLKRLRGKVAVALAQLKRGEYVDGDVAFSDLRRKARARRASRR